MIVFFNGNECEWHREMNSTRNSIGFSLKLVNSFFSIFFIFEQQKELTCTICEGIWARHLSINSWSELEQLSLRTRLNDTSNISCLDRVAHELIIAPLWKWCYFISSLNTVHLRSLQSFRCTNLSDNLMEVMSTSRCNQMSSCRCWTRTLSKQCHPTIIFGYCFFSSGLFPFFVRSFTVYQTLVHFCTFLLKVRSL